MTIIPEAEALNPRLLPASFVEECACCTAAGRHFVACRTLREGLGCIACDGSGLVLTKAARDIIRLLRAVDR